MKAVSVNPRDRKIGIINEPEPGLLGNHDVKLRILDVGVCGTDREICTFEYGTPPEGSPHLIVGHESLGQVVAVGPAVGDISVGDLVVPMVRRPCPERGCLSCQTDRQDFCYTGRFLERGIKEAHGFMTEVVVDHAKYMNRVPVDLRQVAVLVEPLTIAEKAIAQVWAIQSRLPWGCPVDKQKARAHCRTALVLGAGPVGLLGAMVLVANGFETFVYARGEARGARLELLKEIGASYFAASDLPLDVLARKIGNIDLVFEATGASKVSFDVLQHLGTNGVFVLTGVPGVRGPAEIDTDLLMRNLVLKNQIVIGTVNAGREDFASAIADLATFQRRWPRAADLLITARHPPERAVALLSEAPTGIKHVISFN
jgi:threonine dehydrogenase-like Zn-dependent dehydrogenase